MKESALEEMSISPMMEVTKWMYLTHLANGNPEMKILNFIFSLLNMYSQKV